jgi:hypothetical protein
MSRNKDVDYTQYVHEFIDTFGATRYAVAKWENNQYICPLDAHQRKLSGCTSEFATNLQWLGGYLTRQQALRRARYLFGGK